MGRRTKARECALQMIYQWEITKDPMTQVADRFWNLRSTTDATKEMAERLATGAREHVTQLDEAVARAAKNWRLSRIAGIDRAILRIGAYELFHEPQTPPSVIIDEAVEMAKRFSEAEAPSFVNGILDAIMREARGDVAPRPRGGSVPTGD